MARRGYSQNIRVDAITYRLQGNTWETIQDWIEKQYGVKPSIRQMQKWAEKYQHGKNDPTGIKPIASKMGEMIDRAIMLAEGASGAKAVEFPAWLATSTTTNSELDLKTTIVSSLRFLELQVGKEQFDNALQYYQEIRDQIDSYAGTNSGPTGPSGPDGPRGPSLYEEEMDTMEPGPTKRPSGSHRPFEPGGPTGSAGSLDTD